MKQISLKLKSYASNVNIMDNPSLQKRILNTIFLSFGIISICYLLVIAGVVFNIGERKAFDTQARNLINEVGDLELSYLSKSNNIDMSLSKSMGYVEVKAEYATRRSIQHVSKIESDVSIKLAKNEI